MAQCKRLSRRNALALLAGAVPAACAARRPSAGSLPPPPYPLVHLGPERLSPADADRRRDLKLALLERMNRDRAGLGLPPLRYEPRAAQVGDSFCLEAALQRTLGHWDRAGQPPYLRWGLAGGVDFHAQNVSAYSVSSELLDRPLSELLFLSHERMLNEGPPNDGHRRLILDPSLTHVGVGMASFAGEFRMSQEFTRVRFDWLERPSGPLREGDSGYLSGRPLPGWELVALDVHREPPPQPLSAADVNERHAYSYPPLLRRLRPRLPAGRAYADGGSGDVPSLPDGRFAARFPLDAGPGFYVVVCHVGRVGESDGATEPATAVLIEALP